MPNPTASRLSDLRQQERALAAERERLQREFDQKVIADFGRAVRSARERSGLTQQELADAVWLSRASIANIESGRQAVQLPTLVLLAEALGAPVDSLVSAP